MMGLWSNTVDALGAALFPADCLLCEQALRRPLRGPVCSPCVRSLPRLTEPFCPRCALPYAPQVAPGLCGPCRRPRRSFRFARAPLRYEDGVRQLLHALKFGGRERVADRLGPLAASSVPRPVASYGAVVPVPLSRRRFRERGFNQAERLARAVAGRAVDPRVLTKRRDNPPQAGLAAGARRRNVAGTYQATVPEPLRGADLLLVDDVMTTGATVEAASRVLLRGGARTVDVLVLARVPD